MPTKIDRSSPEYLDGPEYAELRAIRKQGDELLQLARDNQSMMLTFGTRMLNAENELRQHASTLSEHDREIEELKTAIHNRPFRYSRFAIVLCMTCGVATGLLLSYLHM